MSSDNRVHSLRIELVDEPGELIRALSPVAECGGNLLSIFHERGSITPRGHIPVEVDLECSPAHFEQIVDKIQDAGIRVVSADSECYDESLTLLLVGDLVATDLSDTVSRLESAANATVADITLTDEVNESGVASARLRLAIENGNTENALTATRNLAAEKDFCVVEPLVRSA